MGRDSAPDIWEQCGYMNISYARIAQATFSKLGSGYNVTLVVREDGHTRDPAP
jgi:hypothetical protein